MGLFQSQSSTRSSFRRASLGTLLCLAGVFLGVFVGVPKLHQALTLSQTPVVMTCLQLLQSGIPEESSLITLTDATIHPPGDIAVPIDNASMPGLAKMQTILADPRAKGFVDQIVRGDVLPAGVPYRSGHQPLKLSLSRQTAGIAQSEVERSGTLTVQVNEDPTMRIVSNLAGSLNIPLPDSLADQTDLPAYTLHPVSMIGSRNEAIGWTVAGAIALTMGWVLCGSAKIGWWVILSPIAVIVGSPGIPFRNGRGNRFTRLLGFVAGLGSLAAAYHLAFTMGGLGQPNGQWLWQSAGFVAASFGAACWIGMIVNSRASRTGEFSEDSLNQFGRSGKKKSKSQRERDFENQMVDQSSGKPSQLQKMLKASDYTRRYFDSKLSVSMETETNGSLGVQNKALEKMQFDSPLLIEHCSGEDMIHATIQVGCRNLVMVVLEEIGDDMRVRLTSILEDGHVIISSGGCDDRLSEDFAGEATTVNIFKSSKATGLVTKHLERAAEVAEKRQTKMVTFEPNEWRDVVHYSERCLAQTMHELKIERWDITSAHYGRFEFPPVAVLMPAMAP